jgi:hypothetical protein
VCVQTLQAQLYTAATAKTKSAPAAAPNLTTVILLSIVRNGTVAVATCHRSSPRTLGLIAKMYCLAVAAWPMHSESRHVQ